VRLFDARVHSAVLASHEMGCIDHYREARRDAKMATRIRPIQYHHP